MEAKYSIADLERLSGIKAHTIRIWEHRFGVLEPNRLNGHRYYNNEDLKLILNISLLNNHGYKISKIAELSKQQIYDIANNILFHNCDDQEQINALSIAMIDMNEEQFEILINQCIQKLGFRHSIEYVVFPFLRRVGYMWQVGTIFPAQEHFMSNLIRQKLITAISYGNFQKKINHKIFILFLPERELHELSLLYFSYLIQVYGHKVIYLGQAVPFVDLEMVYKLKKPYALLSVVTQPFENNQIQEFLNTLDSKFKESKIYITGSQFFDPNNKFRLPNSINLFSNPTNFEDDIKAL